MFGVGSLLVVVITGATLTGQTKALFPLVQARISLTRLEAVELRSTRFPLHVSTV